MALKSEIEKICCDRVTVNAEIKDLRAAVLILAEEVQKLKRKKSKDGKKA